MVQLKERLCSNHTQSRRSSRQQVETRELRSRKSAGDALGDGVKKAGVGIDV